MDSTKNSIKYLLTLRTVFSQLMFQQEASLSSVISKMLLNLLVFSAKTRLESPDSPEQKQIVIDII